MLYGNDRWWTMKTLDRRDKSPKQGSSEDFNQEARQALGQLQEAVRRVLAAVMVGSIRPTDLCRVFGLDYALAWQIHALTEQHDLLMSGRIVPKRGAMERFMLAAERIGPENLARPVREAYEGFERVVAELAGGRDAFDAMLTLQRPTDGAGLRKARRAAHKANAAVWGVTCRCKTHMVAFRTRPTGEFDSLAVLGYVGLQRLHASAMVSTLATTRTWDGKGPAPDGVKPDVVECGLIEEACSTPLPRIESTVSPDGSPQDFLKLNGMGLRSESTVFWRSSKLGVPNTTSTPPHNIISSCRVPAERLLLDFLMPRGWVSVDSAQAWITPDPGQYIASSPTTPYRLPFEGTGKYLGTALSALHSTAVPHYADIVRKEIERLGWNDTEFDIFRCEVEYPILHSTVNMRVE